MPRHSRYLGVLVAASAALFGCASETITETMSAPDAGTKSKPAPTSAADAPPLEHLESTIQEQVRPGNTPFPQGVRCDPESSTDADIVYACTVLVSKTQTATETGLTCGALDPKLESGSGSTPLTAGPTTKAGASFALTIPKAAFPSLSAVSLTASCSSGGVRIGRPYRLTRKSA